MTQRRCRSPVSVVNLCACALLVACGGEPSGASPGAAAPATGDAAEARQLFDSLCVTCHGSSGHGDGPGAATLDPKPRSFVDAAWQDSVTDQQIAKTIVYGGAAVGKSPMMPPQPQLKGKDGVLQGLAGIIRGFRGK